MAWFETWFDTPYYHILYKDRDFKEAESFITLLISYLKLPENSRIIDLACGKGRHSVFLHKNGMEVLGLDLSPQSISHNRKFETAGLRFEVHDMRNPITKDLAPTKVSAVFNLFTSFGYFEDEKDDRKVFESISNILEDGGYFVLDFLNARWVEKTLKPQETVTKEHLTFDIRKKIENECVIKDIRFSDKGEKHHYFEKVKLHTLEEIKTYADDYGFTLTDVFGDYALNPYDKENSPRCISVFKKLKQNSQP